MAVATGNRTQTILVRMLCGMFDVEREMDLFWTWTWRDWKALRARKARWKARNCAVTWHVSFPWWCHRCSCSRRC